MSFYSYSTPVTLKREREDAKARQREVDRQRQENLRKQLDQNSARGIRREEQEAKDAFNARKQDELANLIADQKTLTASLRNESVWLLEQPDEEFPRDTTTIFHSDLQSTAHEKAERYSEDEFNAFMEENPGYFSCEENATILTAYFAVNQNSIVINRAQFKFAYDKLRDAGLLLESDSVYTEPETEQPKFTNVEEYDFSRGKKSDLLAGWDQNGNRIQMTHRDLDNLLNTDERAYKAFCRDAMKRKPAPKPEDGEWGWERGQKVHKTSWEVAQMSSEEYKRFARPRTNLEQLIQQPDLVSDL